MKTILAILAILTSCNFAYAQLPVKVTTNQQALLKSDNPQLQRNKKLVYNFWREVLQAKNMKVVNKYMAKDYMQHNPTVPTGRKAFVNFFSQFKQQPVKPTIDNLVSIVAERDLVVLAFRRTLKDPKYKNKTYTTTWFDMLRIKNGKIVEHWDYGTR
jgi:predicted SnoaL-like aldol condensation-catalyzing enzyme